MSTTRAEVHEPFKTLDGQVMFYAHYLKLRSKDWWGAGVEIDQHKTLLKPMTRRKEGWPVVSGLPSSEGWLLVTLRM